MKSTSISTSLTTMAVVMALLLGCSAAQTTHNVGGSLGWGIVPGGQSAYTSWARNQSFTLGDTLVFTFANGQHDVTEVSRADFDACNINNPIFTITNTPARVPLNSTGSHYYICTFTGHCNAGQKLQVNVTAAASNSSPAPQPAAPPPRASTPAPTASSPAPGASSPSTPPAATPSSSPPPSTVTNSAPAPGPASRGAASTYTVGDNIGWTIPTGGAAAYQAWASDKTFMVGDVLVFNYPSGQHDVTEVTRQSYQSCSGRNPISRETNPPTRITLTAGEHYFICTFNGHCSLGQQLAINVTGGGSNATPPSPSSTSVPSAPSPADSSATSLGFAAVSAATLFSLIVALFFVF